MKTLLTRTRSRFLGVAVAALFAGACSVDVHDYRAEHPIIVEPTDVTLSFLVNDDGSIDATDLKLLDGFASDYRRRGEGRLEIQVPVAHNDEDAARYRAFRLSRELVKNDISVSDIAVRLIPENPYDDLEEPLDIILLSFEAYDVVPPNCGDWPVQEWPSDTSQPMQNYGCSVQRNIGLMVANPKDLIKKRASSARSGRRSNDVLTKYETGVSTISAGDVDATLTTGE